MNIGKLENSELERIVLRNLKRSRKMHPAGSEIGVDCAILDVSSANTVALSTDPITAANNKIGYLTVHVNCNDAAAAGAEPVGLLVTILAPPETHEEELAAIALDLASAAESINVDILGGHTEITTAVSRIVTSATVIACPITENVILPSNMRIGNSIVMTKTAGIEGTSIIALDYADSLTDILNNSELKEARNFLDSLSVLPEGLAAARMGALAMHDITEGGVLGALWEMTQASGLGIVVDIADIPVHPLTKKICEALGLNPYRLLSSGSMLIACDDGDAMVRGLRAQGISSAVIAHVSDSGFVASDGTTLDRSGADEIYKL